MQIICSLLIDLIFVNRIINLYLNYNLLDFYKKGEYIALEMYELADREKAKRKRKEAK
jgi:hypothetical protein